MIRKSVVFVLLLCALSVTIIRAPRIIAQSDGFEKPVRKTVVKLGWSRYLMPTNRQRIRLTCDYYPTFMVKELDDPGMKGTRWVKMISNPNRRLPACQTSHSSGERLVAEDGTFFIGTKSGLLFLEDPDGLNGGMGFHVLNIADGRRVFKDIALAWESGKDIQLLKLTNAPNKTTLLQYRRVVESDCSIPKDGLACWNKLRTEFGLGKLSTPSCKGYLEKDQKEGTLDSYGIPLDDIKSVSVITYPVEVALSPRPVVKVVAGPVTCSAPD